MSDQTTDIELRAIFSETRTIAVVGFSANPARPSHYVAEFLARRGYRVIPVNPGLAGQEFLGTTVRASFSEITEPVDMVDIFRRSEDIPPVVDEALRALPGLSTVWMQLGIRNALAADAARAAGVRVVEDRCPKIEIPRLFAPGWQVEP